MKLLKLIPVLFLAIFLATPALAREEAGGDIDARAASALIKESPAEILIVDVRTPAEFSQGHLPNARNMDFFGPRFEQEAAKLPKDKTVLLYCKSGKRSSSAAEILKEAGIKKVLNMKQGLTGWEKAGLPVEKP